MVRKLLIAVLALALAFALLACHTDAGTDASESQGSTNPVEINPSTPVDKAETTVDEANEAIEQQTEDVNGLADDE